MLVGGQTRMPIVQERLTKLFGKAPSKAVHPDEAVAIGAALYGWSLREDARDLKLQLLDVIPMAIGIEQAGGTMHVVFPRNASIPNARAVAATNSIDGQSELVVRIFQGDRPRTARERAARRVHLQRRAARPAPARRGSRSCSRSASRGS